MNITTFAPKSMPPRSPQKMHHGVDSDATPGMGVSVATAMATNATIEMILPAERGVTRFLWI
jgi:hypothetical protein